MVDALLSGAVKPIVITIIIIIIIIIVIMIMINLTEVVMAGLGKNKLPIGQHHLQRQLKKTTRLQPPRLRPPVCGTDTGVPLQAQKLHTYGSRRFGQVKTKG